MIPVSVCIIAKNEEEKIQACLREIRKHPFEIIVVDTGSTDATKEIASKFADIVADFEWCNDFSAARNFSISLASHDWILVIDCDETITEFNFHEMQKMIAAYPEAIGLLTRDNLCYGKNKQQLHTYDLVPRLFNKKVYHYEDPIHEQVVRLDGKQGSGFEFPLTIVHTGYLGTEEDLEKKADRNIELLKLSLSKDKNDPYLYYQLGESYKLKNDYETAYEFFDRGFYLEVDEKLEYVQRMLISYGYCLIYTNRIEKALSLANVYDSFCDNADYLFMMGNVYLNARLNDKALMEFLKATSVKKHFDEGTNSYRAFHCIGSIYEAYGQLDMAKQYYEKAGDYPPAKERLAALMK